MNPFRELKRGNPFPWNGCAVGNPFPWNPFSGAHPIRETPLEPVLPWNQFAWDTFRGGTRSGRHCSAGDTSLVQCRSRSPLSDIAPVLRRSSSMSPCSLSFQIPSFSFQVNNPSFPFPVTVVPSSFQSVVPPDPGTNP